ncbi:MAG: hypothetical protein JKX72_03005 [Robiginitomaculum sp.]|nr:hypothetical protein [Robiginitomaculum sp.]
MRKSIGADLFRIGGRDNAHVTCVTYEKISGFGGEIFVPGGDFGNIALLRPINPTLHETKIASEQLEKAGAILEFIQSSQRSREDIALLADQAAQIMT